MTLDDAVLFERIDRNHLSYCSEVAPIARLMVRVDVDGRLLIKGRREEIEALIATLRERGVQLDLKYLSFCG